MSPSAVEELPAPRLRAGIDVVDVERMRRALGRTPRLAAKLFTAAERAYCEARADAAVHYAARFAAKEATRKALGRVIPWHAAEVRSAGTAPPRLLLAERRTYDGLEVASAWVSLTHDGGVASAIVVVETCDGQVPEAPVSSR